MHIGETLVFPPEADTENVSSISLLLAFAAFSAASKAFTRSIFPMTCATAFACFLLRPRALSCICPSEEPTATCIVSVSISSLRMRIPLAAPKSFMSWVALSRVLPLTPAYILSHARLACMFNEAVASEADIKNVVFPLQSPRLIAVLHSALSNAWKAMFWSKSSFAICLASYDLTEITGCNSPLSESATWADLSLTLVTPALVRSAICDWRFALRDMSAAFIKISTGANTDMLAPFVPVENDIVTFCNPFSSIILFSLAISFVSLSSFN